MKHVSLNASGLAGIVLVAVLVASLFTYVFVSAAGEITVTEDSFQSDYSYLIFKDGSTYYAKNGETGEISWESTNIITVINNAMDNGNKIVLGKGEFDFGSSGLTINKNGVYFGGLTGSLSNYGTIIKYSGTGTAITVGSSGTIKQDIIIENIRVDAYGDANSSASAIGIKLIDVIHCELNNVGCTRFEGGIGMYLLCSASQYTVGVTINNPYLWYCKTGITTDGIGSAHAIGNILITNPQIYCANVENTLGLRFGAYTSAVNVLGGFVENADWIGYYIASSTANGVTLIGTNSQGMDAGATHIYNSGYNTTVINHKFSGAGTYVNKNKDFYKIIACWNYVTETTILNIKNTTSTTFVYEHGCAGAPDSVLCQFNAVTSAEIKGYSTSNNATHTTVTVYAEDGKTLPATMTITSAKHEFIP